MKGAFVLTLHLSHVPKAVGGVGRPWREDGPPSVGGMTRHSRIAACLSCIALSTDLLRGAGGHGDASKDSRATSDAFYVYRAGTCLEPSPRQTISLLPGTF